MNNQLLKMAELLMRMDGTSFNVFLAIDLLLLPTPMLPLRVACSVWLSVYKIISVEWSTMAKVFVSCHLPNMMKV